MDEHGSRVQPAWRLWFDQGGVVAIANLRGGGEFGEAWHRGGNLTRKQNVFDDFVGVRAAPRRRAGHEPERLAILGGSNGGLLMGARAHAAPGDGPGGGARVGIYDMLRVELTPNGALQRDRVRHGEGSEQFKALYAYSPYHHVKEGTAYPAILFLHRRERPAGGSMALEEDGGAAAGGLVGLGAHPAPGERLDGPRGRDAALGRRSRSKPTCSRSSSRSSASAPRPPRRTRRRSRTSAHRLR